MSKNGGSLDGIFADGEIRDSYIKAVGGICGEDNPAYFTFLASRSKNDESKFNFIFPFPDNLESFLNNVSSEDKIDQLQYNKFLESLPKIQIRAFVPDTILQYAQGLLETVFQGVEYAKNNQASDILNDFSKQVGRTVEQTKKFFSGMGKANNRNLFYESVGRSLKDQKFSKTKIGDHDVTVLDIPYNLYYKILGATTNAIYEIPTIFPSNLLTSDGKFGWSTNSNSNILPTAAIGGGAKGSAGAIFSGVLGLMKNKMGLTIMPFFNPSTAAAGENSDKVEIILDLVNDTFEHALSNFKFVQTLHLNNKWIQTGIFNGPANLYDISIPGGTRLFMCTAVINITFKGAIRKIHPEIPDEIKTKEGISDSSGIKPFGREMRIPESYSIKITFESLLPNNFNAQILGLLSANADLFDYNDGKRREEGTLNEVSKAFGRAVQAVTDFETINTTKDKDGKTINDVIGDDIKSKNISEEQQRELFLDAETKAREQLNDPETKKEMYEEAKDRTKEELEKWVEEQKKANGGEEVDEERKKAREKEILQQQADKIYGERSTEKVREIYIDSIKNYEEP